MVFSLHIPSGQVMVFSVAILLKNGHGSSHMASLYGCSSYWVPSILQPPLLCNSGGSKAPPPTVVSPWMAQLAIFLHSVHTSVCSLFIKVFSVKPSAWARGFLPGQKDTLMAEYFPLRNGDKNCLLGVWTRV